MRLDRSHLDESWNFFVYKDGIPIFLKDGDIAAMAACESKVCEVENVSK